MIPLTAGITEAYNTCMTKPAPEGAEIDKALERTNWENYCHGPDLNSGTIQRISQRQRSERYSGRTS